MARGNFSSWPFLPGPGSGGSVSARQYGLGWAVATDPQYGYSSGTDIGPAVNAAITALLDDGDADIAGGVVIIPPGDWTLSTPIILKTGITIQGAGRQVTRIVSAVGVFRWTGANLSSAYVKDMSIRSTAGHVFTNTGGDFGIYTTTVESCHIYVSDPDSSIMHHDSALDYDRVRFRDCYLTRAQAATVPAFYIRNSGGAANENVWEDCWLDTGGSSAGTTDGLASTHFFHLENTGAANYAYDNVFRNLIGERTQAGLINALSVSNLIIDNCVAWDAETNYARHWINIGKSAAGLASRFVQIRGGGRRGGTLDASVNDINFVSGAATDCVVESFNHSSSGTKIGFNPANRIHILNTTPGAYTDQPANSRVMFGDSPHLPLGAYVGTATSTATTDGLQFGDAYLYRTSATRLRTNGQFFADSTIIANSQGGAAVTIGAAGPGSTAGVRLGANTTWSAGAGTPEGAVAANPGSLYSNTSGGAGATLYVKESGTGNTGWVAK